MWRLRIRDQRPQGPLAFDLRDVLRALGPDALKWQWVVSGVDDEGVMATGPGADELETLARSGASVSGDKLLEIAGRTDQVIWGSFGAPSLSIVAFDSSWYDVVSADKALLSQLAQAFEATALTSSS